MAQSTLNSRIRVLAAKAETTPGTVIGAAAADAVFNAYDYRIDPIPDMFHRDRQGGAGELKARQGTSAARCSFRTDLHSVTAASQPLSVLLPACGWVDTAGTFSPKLGTPGTNGITTITLREDINGTKTLMRGCAGRWRMEFVAGRAVQVFWEFLGIWSTAASATTLTSPVTDATIMSPSLNTASPLRFAASAMTLASSYTPRLSRLTLDCGNDVQMREDGGGGDVSGYSYAMIRNRVVNGSMDPEFDLIANRDWFGIWQAETEEALAFTLGTTGNAIAFAAPKLQMMSVSKGRRGDIEIVNVGFQCNPSSGNDELTLAYS
jgi:hypothetical protein